jgi:hypothetical protein
MSFLKDPGTDRSCLACRLSRAICRTATTKTLVASFLLWLVFLILIMGRPFGIAQLQEITGGPTIPDMTFTTGPDSVYAVLGALGAAGRAFDLGHIVPLDLIFPFTYALFLSLGISWGLARLLQKGNPLHLLNLAPVCAAAADYCENAGVIALLLTYPSRHDAVAWWTSAMYVIKFVFSTLSWVVFMAAVAIWLVVVVSRKIRNP